MGIDVGGTHTDIVLVDSDGGVRWVDKVPSDPVALSTPFVRRSEPCQQNRGSTCASTAQQSLSMPSFSEDSHASLCVATRGFGDILYIRRETKANIYDLDWRKPEPLIPRHLTFEIDERIDAGGAVVRPLRDLKLSVSGLKM